MNTKQAKDFLVAQTVPQAALDGVSLDDVEKRMMYFTESDPSSCENPIELNDEFEEQHETNEYEAKISRLLHRAHTRLKKESPQGLREWDEAMRALRKGDHYILVLNSQAGSSDLEWKPFFWGIGISFMFAILAIVAEVLSSRGLIPGWVFGWISNDRSTRKLEFELVLFGCLGFWVIVTLARAGVLGGIAKELLGEMLSPFKSLLSTRRSRK